MPTYDGKHLTIDLAIRVLGVTIDVIGTVEILDIRKRVDSE